MNLLAALALALAPHADHAIHRCEEWLTRGLNLTRGGITTVRHIRNGINVPPGSTLKAPPAITPLELAKLMKILVVDGNQLGFTQEASRLALQYGGAAYIPLASGFGDGGTVVVVDPELVNQVFQLSSDRLVRGADFDIIRQIIGMGVLSSDGEQWSRQRKALMPLMYSRRRLGNLIPAMNEVIRKSISRMDAVAGTLEPINFHELMKETTLSVITKVLFSYDISDADAAIVSHTLAQALDFSTRYSVPVTLYKDPRLPIEDAEFQRSVAAMNAVSEKIIAWRLAHPLPGDFAEALPAPELMQTDALSHIFQDVGLERGKAPTETQMKQLRDGVMTLMLAGHETTANAITWTWVNLLEHPENFHRMVAEIDGTLAGREASHGDLRRMEFTERVHRESLRHDSPVYWFARHADEPVAIGPYHIPGDTHVFFSTLAVHRHPGQWENGEAFNPDRYSNARSIDGRHKAAECPFAQDGHFCLGQLIATAELNLISINIAQRYELFKEDPSPTVREGKVTLQPRGGFWVRVRHRLAPAPQPE